MTQHAILSYLLIFLPVQTQTLFLNKLSGVHNKMVPCLAKVKKSNIKHERPCLTTHPDTERRVENTNFDELRGILKYCLFDMSS